MSDITANIVVSAPSQLFTMPRSFKAIANGKIYIGQIDTDPVNPANQIQVYLENEDGSHVPVAQPLIINAGGYPVYNGQIAKFVTVQGHSMAVYDAYGVQQFYYPNILKYDPDQLRQELSSPLGIKLVKNGGIYVESISEMTGLNLEVGDYITVGAYYESQDGSSHYRIIESSDNGCGVQLLNGLWANIPLNIGDVDISWIGAKKQSDFDSLSIFTKALSTFKAVKFSGHYYVSSGIKMNNAYSLRGENMDSSIIEITSTSGGSTTGAIIYDLPLTPGQNVSVKYSNLSDMTLLSNINQGNWETDGSGMVHSGIYAGAGDGLSGGVALSTINNVKIIGFNYATDIKQGYLDSIDNIRAEKCNHGIAITGGTSYSIGLISVSQVKNFCYAFDNMLYSCVRTLIADYCDVSRFLGATNSQIDIGTIGVEFLTNLENMYRLSASKVSVGTAKYIGISGVSTGAFYYLDGGSYLCSETEDNLNDGWGMPPHDVAQSDLILGNFLNIRRQVYENIYKYTSYDLDTLLGFRGYGKLFQFTGANLPGSGNWVIDFVATYTDLGISGKGSYQVATSIDTGDVKRRRFDGVAWTEWA
ncbi:phage head-binding domain-containing protein [Citrobacter sp. Cf039]|uniref:phage head-binding domain-containing protein n=1 Tax=Citrobacter sp. Cf039 TaxID=2985044 RepID=UPI002578B89E|nr:phage head-binding domain-containing protein [Citrobacter sp. Cf039]MDM3265674.1 phage head-binding domain-containing protein [Citrobacter sp. Cf039]